VWQGEETSIKPTETCQQLKILSKAFIMTATMIKLLPGYDLVTREIVSPNPMSGVETSMFERCSDQLAFHSIHSRRHE
jgi:hypothetical protein